MDDYDASKAVDEAVQDQIFKLIKRIKFDLNLSATFVKLIKSLISKHEEHLMLERGLHSSNLKHEFQLLTKGIRTLSFIIESVEQAYHGWSEVGLEEKKPRTPNKRSDKIKRGTRTSEEDFRYPILKTLQDMGGPGRIAYIL